jgi:hypothetical protein
MSRAFIKEDAAPPEAESLGEFRVYWGLSRYDVEAFVVYSSGDLLDVMQWALSQTRGYFQIRDALGMLLSEVDSF